MRRLYVLDNGRAHSAHDVHFVVCDPDEWGSDIDELMLWRLRFGEWSDKGASLLLVSDRFDIRDEAACSQPQELLAVRDFVFFPEDSPGCAAVRRPGCEILGAARARKLSALWRERGNANPRLLDAFDRGIELGWFGP